MWQLDTLPYTKKKVVTPSRQDQEAISLFESTHVKGDRVLCYVTRLLCKKDMPHFHAPNDAVIPSLRSTERQLAKDPEWIRAYNVEIQKLVQVGSVLKLESNALTNEKFKGQNLHESLLPRPSLGPSLLGVLLRFSEHPVIISGDIKEMFHQVCLLS